MAHVAKTAALREAHRREPSLRARLRVATQDSILDAAEQSLVEEGVEGASLQAIARRAGVAVGTIYNYFPDRQELFRALFQTRRAELLAALDAAMKENARAPFVKQLEHFATTVLAHCERRRDFMRVAISSEPLRLQMMIDKAGRFRPVADELRMRVEHIMRVGVREKRVREAEVTLLASVFTSIIRGALLASLSLSASLGERKVALASTAPRIVEIFCHGGVSRS